MSERITSTTEYVMIITTTDQEADAVRLARRLVEERLVACAQIDGPIRSFYHWDGRLEDTAEYRITFKTATTAMETAFKAIRRLHPYRTPQLVALPITAGSPDYLAWIDRSLNADGNH
jgi:Uncharacterized protein involved in tolerance to divalent cations